MSVYQGQVRKHFLSPRNIGEVAEADAVGDVGSLQCGSVVRFTLRIDPASQRITEAKFKAAGCGVLVACASFLTERLQELTIGEAARLSEEDLINAIGVVEPAKRQCITLCVEALYEAALDYRSKTLEEWTGEEALICTCFGISEKTIEREISTRSLNSIEQVTRACNAGAGCRSCHPLIEDILDDYWRTKSTL